MGTSPTYNVQYDDANPTLVALFLPRVRQAANIIGDAFDNRVNISVTLALDTTLDPGVLGSASSRRYRLRWDDYLEGLRNQSLREGDTIAGDFPTGTIPANFSTGLTNVDQVTVTEAQYRAIFGDTVRDQNFSSPAVSIRYNPAFDWSFVDPCIGLPSNQTSLTDVAAHEFVHPLGFVSEIRGPGDSSFVSFVDNNPNNRLSGLDLARFAVNFNPLFPLVFPPFSVAEFTAQARNGEGNALFPFQHQYVNPAAGTNIDLETGNDQQPSHLAGNLGLMDATISQGETNCPFYLVDADIRPLDDMGWRPIVENGQQDCNNNGVIDAIDILNGTADFDEDGIPDICENFPSGDANTPAGPEGVLRTIYEGPGFTSFASFNPDTATVVRDQLRSVFFSNLNLGSAAPRVARYRAKFFVPAYDDTAFRVERPDDALLIINGQTVLNSTQAGDLETDSGFVSDVPAAQSFIQLDSGWFDIELFTFQTGTNITGDLIVENRNPGGWDTIPTANLRATLFEDCNNNGINDASDPDALIDCRDCNNDGIPDANQDLFETVTDLGTLDILSGATFDLFATTNGSSTDFDTEIALYNADTGLLIEENDDIGGGTLSSAVREDLAPGNYSIIIAGFNTVFADNFDITFPDCPAAGNYSGQIDVIGIGGSIQSGFVDRYNFTIALPDCDNDGTPDADELDCDADGIPDDCQKPQLSDFSDGDLEVIANENDTVTFDTFGSNFDTEIAVYDRDGNFVAFNDDAGSTLQSEVSRSYAPGEYILVLAGFDTAFFADNFFIVPNAGTPRSCAAGGNIFFNFAINGIPGDSNDTDLPSGRLLAIPFAIEPAPLECNPADIALPFGILDLADIDTFIAGFLAQDPIADIAPPAGVFDLSDIDAFISAFVAGCP